MCCVFVCVSASVSASHWQAMGTSSRVCQNGQGAGWQGWSGRWTERWRGGSRDRLLSVMDAPINLSALGSSKKRCGGWRHLKGEEKSLNSHKVAGTWAWCSVLYILNGGWIKTSKSMFMCARLPSYLLSRNVGVGAGGGPSLWLAIGWDVEEVPDQNGIVMRTAYDLKLIKLEAEHAARVLLKTTERVKRLWYRAIQTLPHIQGRIH